MSRYLLAPRAKKDLLAIGRYTQKKWGVKQRNTYLLGLERRFQWLADQPKLGRHRTDIKHGYYSYRHELHTVFYTIDADQINIIGVVGDRQSLEKYFGLV